MPAPDCIFFLRHVQYPSTAFVLLLCSPTRVRDCSTILSLVGLNLHRAQSVETGTLQLPTTIRSARLESSGADTARTMFFNNTKSYASSSSEYFIPGPIIDIRFNDIEDIEEGYTNDHLFTNICNSFDLSTLEFLYINWNFSSLQTQEIRNTLGELPKLELIHVAQHLPAVCLAISESSEDLAEVAGEVEYQHGSEQQYILPPTAVFPALKTLVISKVDFWKYRYPERLDYVTDVLMKRANMDLPIERLWIKRCAGVQIWQMRLLRELVVNFQFDRWEVEMGELDCDPEGLPMSMWSGDYNSDKEDSYFARLNKLGWPICD